MSGSVADFLEVTLALRYKKKDDENLMPVWSRLGQISQEMKSRGFLVCNQSVLWHWHFAPRNILVGCTPGNKMWEVTAVLDWDGVLYAPRVLTREPPVWLWQIGDESSRATLDDCFDIPRNLKKLKLYYIQLIISLLLYIFYIKIFYNFKKANKFSII